MWHNNHISAYLMQLLWDNVFHSFSEVFQNAFYYCGMFSINIYSIKTNLHSSLKKVMYFCFFVCNSHLHVCYYSKQQIF